MEPIATTTLNFIFGTIEYSFGDAVSMMKVDKNRLFSRKGWNGKGMFIWLKPGAIITSDMIYDPILKAVCIANGGSIEALPTMSMYTTNASGRKAILTGWLASQSDIVADDYVEVFIETIETAVV